MTIRNTLQQSDISKVFFSSKINRCALECFFCNFRKVPFRLHTKYSTSVQMLHEFFQIFWMRSCGLKKSSKFVWKSIEKFLNEYLNSGLALIIYLIFLFINILCFKKNVSLRAGNLSGRQLLSSQETLTVF